MNIKKIPIGLLTLSALKGGRQIYDKQQLENLKDSIKNDGMLQPIVVRPKGDRYEVIAGHRRYKASKMAEESFVWCVVKDSNDAQAMKESIVENTLRDDLTNWELRTFIETLAKKLGDPYFVDGSVSATNMTRFILGEKETARSTDKEQRLNLSLRNRIQELTSLNKAPKKLQDLVDSERLDIRSGYTIMTIRDPVNRDKLIQMADDGVSSHYIRHQASRMKTSATAKKLSANFKKIPDSQFEKRFATMIERMKHQSKVTFEQNEHFIEFLDDSENAFKEFGRHEKYAIIKVLTEAHNKTHKCATKIGKMIKMLRE